MNILVLDGGGTRGLYTATVLKSLEDRFSRRWGQPLDIGAAFDVVVGTSTGGILASGVVGGISLDEICSLYRNFGAGIFADPLPSSGRSLRERLRIWRWMIRNRRSAAGNQELLRRALSEIFGETTLGELYSSRGIGLCLTATSLLDHEPRVFKTAHRTGYDRDHEISIVEACLATSAAPFYLPAARTGSSVAQTGIYCDGGLWANSPILVGLLEGLMLSEEDQPVEIISVGTCSPPTGSVPQDLNLGLVDWRGGVGPLILSMDTQVAAGWNTAQLLGEQFRRLGKRISLIRFPETQVASEHEALLGLDSATSKAFDLMECLGEKDAAQTYRWCQEPRDKRGEALERVFQRMTGKSEQGESK